MTDEPSWLSIDDVVGLNKIIVADSAEPFGIRDQNRLASAWGAPQDHYYYSGPDIVGAAAVFCLSIARNHPFILGNKRTAFAAMDNTLRLNGFRLDMPDLVERADLLVAAVVHDIDDEAFIAAIDQHVFEQS